jgi:hypothetical protein
MRGEAGGGEEGVHTNFFSFHSLESRRITFRGRDVGDATSVIGL